MSSVLRSAQMRKDTKTSPTLLALAALLLMVNLFVFLMAGLWLQTSREQYHKRAETNSQNVAAILSQNIGGEIARIDLALRDLAQQVEFELASGHPNQHRLQQIFDSKKEQFPEVLLFRATDAEGDTLLVSNAPVSGEVNVADRDYFAILKADPKAGLAASEPIFAKLQQQWCVAFVRRINGPDGSFAGVVLAPLPVKHFSDMFSMLRFGHDDGISLRQGDLSVVARFPETIGGVSAIGNKAVSPQLKIMTAAHPDRGTYEAAAGIDSIPRILSYQRIPAANWYVVVGLSTETQFSDWRNEVLKVGVLVVTFLGLSILGSIVLLMVNQGRRKAIQRMRLIESAVDHAGEAILLTAPQGLVIYANSAASILLRRSVETMTGSKVWDLLPLPDYQDWSAHWQRLSQGQALPTTAVIDLPDGGRQAMDVAAHHVSHEGQELAVIFVRDASERQRHEAEMQRALSQSRQLGVSLSRKNEEMAQFTEVLAHHLQEPIRLQHVYAQVLARQLPSPLPPLAEQSIRIVLDGAVRLKALMHDVQLYLSVGSGHGDAPRCSPAEALGIALRRLQDRITASGAIVDCDPVMPDLAMPAELLAKALAELLENAILYRHPDRLPQIRLTGQQDGEHLLLKLCDNGLGIAEEYHDRVFKVFERLVPETTPEGTGIGLALVKKIVDGVGGQVWIETAAQGAEGTCICLSLPLAPPDEG